MIPEAHRLDRIPLAILSAALIAAIVGLAGSLTQLLVTGPDSSVAAAAYSRQAAKQMADAGRASFAIMMAGIAGSTIAYLMLRLCWKRIDLALARLVDELQQRIAVRSLDNLLQSEVPHRLGQGAMNSDDGLTNAQVALLQSHFDASMSKAEASLQRSIEQAMTAIVQRLDISAVAPIRRGDGASVEASSKPLEHTIDQALSKFRDDIFNPIGTTIRALDERISAQLSETLSRLAVIAEALANTRSELAATTIDMRSQIANVADEGLREQRSLLAQVTAEVQHSVTTELADANRRNPSSPQLLEVNSSLDQLHSVMHQLREEVDASTSNHEAASTALDNRLRTELASFRLSVQLQDNNQALLQDRTIERMQRFFDSRVQEFISRPLAELATTIANISENTTQTKIGIAELGKSIGSAGDATDHKLGESFRTIDTALEMISSELKRAADSQSEQQRLTSEAAATLTTLNQIAARVEQGTQEAADQITRTATSEQERLRRDIAHAVRSIQTTGELARIKLEESISSLSRTAGKEIEQLSSDVMSKLSTQDATHTNQIEALRDQAVAAIGEFRSLTSGIYQQLRSPANDVRSLIEDAKSKIEVASTEVRQVSETASHEARETLDRVIKTSAANSDAIFHRLDQLANRITEDLQTMLGSLGRPKRIEEPVVAPQAISTKQAATTDLSPPDQLEKTLAALSDDLRRVGSMMAAADAKNSTNPRPKFQRVRAEHQSKSPLQLSAAHAREQHGLVSRANESENASAKDNAVEQTISQFLHSQRTKRQIAG